MQKYLYDLISSLTMNEKAYFKKFASLHSNNSSKNYLRLFNTLLKMKAFDAKAIQEKFKGEPIGRYLSSEMKYLEDQLLKSLTNFSFEKNKQNKNQKNIHFISILIEKGFHQRAKKLLIKTKTSAYRKEEFTTIIKLIQLEEEIFFRDKILDFLEKLTNLNEERNRIYAKIQNINELRLLREQISKTQFIHGYIDDKSKFSNFYNAPIMKTPNNTLSYKAKEHWYYIKSILAYLIRDYKKAQKANLVLLKIMQENEELFNASDILPIVSNVLYSSALLKDKSTFMKILPTLKTLNKKPSIDKIYLSYVRHSRNLELYYQTADLKATEIYLEKITPFVLKSYNKMAFLPFNHIFLLMVRAEISLRRFKKAINWLNIWLKQGVGEYILLHAYCFLLITRYELGWTKLLEAELETTYKLFRRREKYDDLAQAMVGFFKSFLKNADKEMYHLSRLLKKLKMINSIPKKNHAFVYFNYEKWCRNAIDHRL